VDGVNTGLLLTPREGDIAALVAMGMSNKEIGRQLGIRHQTVRNILVNVFRKTSTRKRTQLAVKMILSEYDSAT
jgi:two-component system nitrate/nitrite response regulator NarL